MYEGAFFKDPLAEVDVKIEWEDELASDEVIITRTVTASGGITILRDELADNGRSIVAWVSGGTHLQEAEIHFYIETNHGIKNKRTVLVRVMNR